MSNSTQPPQPWGTGTGQTFASNYSAGFNFNPKPENQTTNPFDALSNSNLIAPGLVDVLKSLPQEQQRELMPGLIANASIAFNTDREKSKQNDLIAMLLDREDKLVAEDRAMRERMTPYYNAIKTKQLAEDRAANIAIAALNRPSATMPLMAFNRTPKDWSIPMPA